MGMKSTRVWGMSKSLDCISSSESWSPFSVLISAGEAEPMDSSVSVRFLSEVEVVLCWSLYLI